MRKAVPMAHFVAILICGGAALAATTGVVLDRNGAPVENAVVRAIELETATAQRARWLSGEAPPVLATAKTGSKGTFTLEVDAPTSRIVIEAPGHAPLVTHALADENLGALAVDPGVDVPIEITAAGKPVEGALVVVEEQEAKTGEDGRVAFRVPRRGSVELRVFHPGFAPFAGSYPRATAVPRRIAVSTGTAIDGLVVDAADDPVTGATIEIDDLPLATSGEDGTFRVHRAPDSWRTIEAIRDDEIAVTTRPAKHETIRLVLREGAILNGTATDAKTGRPLAGTAIVIAPADGWMLRALQRNLAPDAVAGEDGKWSAGPLPAGTWTLVAARIGHEFAPVEVVATAGERNERSLAGQPLGRIEGVVRDEAREPVAAAAVRYELEERRFPMRMQTPAASWTAPDGTFVMRAVPTGQDITLTATRPPAPAAASDPLRLEPGERKRDVMLVIPRGIALTGRVIDSTDSPIAGAEIIAREADTRGFRMMVRTADLDPDAADPVLSGDDGAFTIYLERGAHDLSIDAEGYAPKVLRGVDIAPAVEPLTVVLDQAAVITGRVLRSDGTPVGGASVAAIPMGRFSGAERATTAPDGGFTIGELAAGGTMVFVTESDALGRTTKMVEAPSSDVVIEIPVGTTVRGRVVDEETGAPITEFRAGVSGESQTGPRRMIGPPVMRQFQSEDGSFELGGVPAGAVTLLAEAAGYAPGRLTVTVEEGTPLDAVEIPLEPGTTIHGRVTTSNGTPIAGANVRVVLSDPRMPGMPSSPFEGGIVTTDADGEYTLADVAQGQRVLEARHSEHVGDSQEVEVSGREMRVDFRLEDGAELRGVVVRETGEPVANAQVSVSSAGAQFGRSATTDASGNFHIEGLAPGRYSVTARRDSLRKTVDDVDPLTAGTLRITLASGGTIAGRVSGLSETELTTAMITVRGPGGRTEGSVRHDGTFRVEGAPLGSVNVQAMVRGAGGFRTSAQQTVEVTAGAEAWVDLNFQDGSEITGRVTRNGEPAEGAMVMFSPKDGTAQSQGSTTTGTAGDYAVAGLEDGLYTVRVFAPGSSTPYATEYEVRGNGRFDIAMRAGSVSGRVVDASTLEPVEGASMTLDPAEGGMRFSGGIRSDSAGRFTFTGVASGMYRLRALKEGFAQETQDVQVADGESIEVEVRLQTSPGAELRIVDARDGRPLGGFLSIADAMGRLVYEQYLQPRGDGAYRIPLAPGSYRATVSANGYAPVTFDLPAPSGERTVALSRGGSLRIENSGDPVAIRILDGSGQPWRRGSWNAPGTLRLDAAGLTIDAMAPGNYVLEVAGTSERQAFTIVEGQMTTVRR